jgi:hypothetical protein
MVNKGDGDATFLPIYSLMKEREYSGMRAVTVLPITSAGAYPRMSLTLGLQYLMVPSRLISQITFGEVSTSVRNFSSFPGGNGPAGPVRARSGRG